jgi:hypothetical protein
MGQSPNCGHYTAIAEGSNSMYYQFDDQSVYQVSAQSALNNDAYVIIYEMDRGSRPTANSDHSSSTPASPAFRSSLGLPLTKPAFSSLAKPSTITSEAQAQQKKFTIPFAKTNGSNGTAAMGSALSSPMARTNGPNVLSNLDHKLLQFGTGKNSPVTNGLSSSPSPNKINVLKPGVMLTNAPKLLPPATTVVTKGADVKLVPYNDIDNEESDKEDQVPTESAPESTSTSTTGASTKKFIGPVIEQNLRPTTPKSPTPHVAAPLPSQSSRKSKSPEVPVESRKRLAEEQKNTVASPKIFNKSKEDKGKQALPKKEHALNATSEWTITTVKDKSSSSSGYSSDPESKVQRKENRLAKFARAKSMDRSFAKPNFLPTLITTAPLVPNKKSDWSESLKSTATASEKEEKSSRSEKGDEPVTVNGNHPNTLPSAKKRKRSRSTSSSSSSSSSESKAKRRKKKNMKKKEKRKNKKQSSSSSNSSSSSDENNEEESRHKRSKKKHKKKKKHEHKKRDADKNGKRSKDGKEKDRDFSESRETDSEERDRIRRLARNPSRSPFHPDKNKERTEKFDPAKIDDRGKASKYQTASQTFVSILMSGTLVFMKNVSIFVVVGWDGQQSLLSKCIEDTKREPQKTREEILDEELDQGKVCRILFNS